MRIGHARYCLSPQSELFYLIGYRSEKRKNPAEGIHDDIFCNSILLEIDSQYLFIFSADFLEWEIEMVEEIKTRLSERFDINRDLILICATHNHSSIMSYHKNWHSGVFDKKYYEYVIETAIKSYETCLDTMEEATAKYGSEIITGYYSNRNHPGELADNEISVIQFLNKEGVPFCGIINWAVHATILGPNNNTLSAELPGQVCKKLEEKWGYFPLFIVGAAADSSNRFQRQGNDFKELERVSTGLSEAINSIPITKALQFNEFKYQTHYHTIAHEMKWVHAEAKKFLNKVENEKLDPNSIIANMPLSALINKCKNILDIPNFYLDIKFAVIKIGDLELITFPGELGSEFGIKLKKTTSHMTIIAGYTNGFYHYFLPESEYGLSFETIGTPIPKGEPEKIIEKIELSLLMLSKR